MTLNRSEFADKRIAILGMARTGMAAAPVLRALGARVLLSDMESSAKLGPKVAEAWTLGVDVRTSATPEEALGDSETVVPSPGIPRDAPILQLARLRGMSILSEIEVAYRIAKAPILAVTGTNGKTTTTMLLGEIMRLAGRGTWVAGNIAADEVKQSLITAASQADEDDVIVAEISSFQLEWVEQFRPKVGVLTNITPDHLNRHRTFAEYAGCKERLFAAQRPDDVAVINAVNAPARAIGGRLRSRLFWFDRGNCGGADSACVCGGRILVRWCGEEHVLCRVDELRIPGMHNLENALAAAGAAIAYGIEPEVVAEALRAFTGVVHRMEPIATVGGVLYVNNSMCTNVDAAIRSLEAMGRPTVLIAGGADKNSDFAPLGQAIARSAKHLVLIGQAAPLLESAARDAGFEAISHADSMESAVRIATAKAAPGDAVMLSPACASFDMFTDFEARGEAFRRAVRELDGEGQAA
jgi:UDP-N-acetylmuramoylalanine--D-glutamate ligase